ncbi:MAG: exo-alpha-sialidase [Planctomycetaceae bacterium]|nr:exo-alpha-sialidase [Planctomycetaceae bacterium]
MMPRLAPLLVLLALTLIPGLANSSLLHAEDPFYQGEFVFPFHPQHNHASGLVECPNGDLLISWFRGSGERTADDVQIMGARRKAGQSTWSEPFPMADYPGFPDCNSVLWIDPEERLWLFWPVILDNTWDSCLTNYLISEDYMGEGTPKWGRQRMILLKPNDFSDEYLDNVTNELGNSKPLSKETQGYLDHAKATVKQKLYQRIGWQPRCKPTVLPSGRILMPLYTDNFGISIMAISDDGGKTWYASEPLFGYGNNQPSVLRRDDGTLVAFLRDDAFSRRVRYCTSTDDGLTWSKIANTDFVNPGTSVDGVRLKNGHWVLVMNEGDRDRHHLVIALSDDEGRSWKWKRTLEKQPGGQFHYPAVIQSKDDRIHISYSYYTEQGETMKHVQLNEAWIQAGN